MEVALVDPALDADLPVRRAGLGEAVVDVGLERVERQAPLLVPLRARDLGAVEAAGAADLDPLGAEAEGRLHPLLHRPAERDPALELHRDRLGDELGVRLGALDLDDVDVDVLAETPLEPVAELVDGRALLPDDDAGTGGHDVDLELVPALDLDLGDGRVREVALELGPQLQVVVEEAEVVLLGVPARVPGPVVADAEPVRMNLLTHRRLLLPAGGLRGLRALVGPGGLRLGLRPSAAFAASFGAGGRAAALATAAATLPPFFLATGRAGSAESPALRRTTGSSDRTTVTWQNGRVTSHIRPCGPLMKRGRA